MMLQTLAYEPPVHPTPTRWLHYIALACGLIPLAFGVIDFILFVAIGDETFAFIGVMIIIVGSCMAFVGLVCATVYLFQAKRATPDEGRLARRRGLLDIGVILINFPLATGMTWFGIWLMSRVTLTVHNADAAPLQQLALITDEGERREFGTLAPGARRSLKVTLDDFGDDDFLFSFQRNGVEQQETALDVWFDDEFWGNEIHISIKDGKPTQTWADGTPVEHNLVGEAIEP